jgi:DNA-binding winged helix-turn-helix (wHTH) protein
MPVVATQRVRFGPFTLDTRSGELFKHDLKLKLQGHPVQLLAMLLERPGELITREEIQQKLWPTESETFVDFEHGLNTTMRKLRQALGDEAETPQYIETLPRRGYRFVGEILKNRNRAKPLPSLRFILRQSAERPLRKNTRSCFRLSHQHHRRSGHVSQFGDPVRSG